MFKRSRRHPNIYRDQERGCSREAEERQKTSKHILGPRERMFKRGRTEAEDIQTYIGTKRVDVQERQKTSKHLQGPREWMFKRGRRHPNIYRDQESGCSREAEDIQTYTGTKRVDVQEREKTSKHIQGPREWMFERGRTPQKTSKHIQGPREWMFKRDKRHPNVYCCSNERTVNKGLLQKRHYSSQHYLTF